MRSKCKIQNGKFVCGMLRGGGTVNKSGIYRLHKDEQVFTKGQLQKAGKTKKKGTSKGKSKKKCKCKH